MKTVVSSQRADPPVWVASVVDKGVEEVVDDEVAVVGSGLLELDADDCLGGRLCSCLSWTGAVAMAVVAKTRLESPTRREGIVGF